MLKVFSCSAVKQVFNAFRQLHAVLRIQQNNNRIVAGNRKSVRFFGGANFVQDKPDLRRHILMDLYHGQHKTPLCGNVQKCHLPVYVRSFKTLRGNQVQQELLIKLFLASRQPQFPFEQHVAKPHEHFEQIVLALREMIFGAGHNHQAHITLLQEKRRGHKRAGNAFGCRIFFDARLVLDFFAQVIAVALRSQYFIGMVAQLNERTIDIVDRLYAACVSQKLIIAVNDADEKSNSRFCQVNKRLKGLRRAQCQSGSVSVIVNG